MQFLLNSDEKLNRAELMSLIKVITPYGKALKRRMTPFEVGQEAVLEASYSTLHIFVEALEKNTRCFHETRTIMKELKPLDDTLERLRQKQTLSDIDFFELKQLAHLCQKLAHALTQIPTKLPDHLHLKRLKQVETLLDPENTQLTSFYLYDAYSEPLAACREAHRTSEAELRTYRKRQKEQLEASLQVRFRPNGELTVLKQDKTLLSQLETEIALCYSAENYMSITFKIKDDDTVDRLLEAIEQHRQAIESEEKSVREQLTLLLFKELEAVVAELCKIAELDLWIAKGLLAIGISGTRPEVSTDPEIIIEDGRHIKVESVLRREGRRYTPVSLTLKPGVTLITGANMGGKTVSLKLIGLLSTFLHYGLYIPAKRYKAPLLTHIYISVGDMQSIDEGLSTFGSEIYELAQVLKQSQGRGLLLIDELARGTNPEEGNALTTAILKHLNHRAAFTVVTTHFDGVKAEEPIRHYQVVGLRHTGLHQKSHERMSLDRIMDVLNQEMDYRLEEITDTQEVPRDALLIASLMGLESDIIDEAHRAIHKRT